MNFLSVKKIVILIIIMIVFFVGLVWSSRDPDRMEVFGPVSILVYMLYWIVLFYIADSKKQKYYKEAFKKVVVQESGISFEKFCLKVSEQIEEDKINRENNFFRWISFFNSKTRSSTLRVSFFIFFSRKTYKIQVF